MNKINGQAIYNMQNDDYAYGDFNSKKVIKKDKSQKNSQNFSRMKVADLIAMNQDDDDEAETLEN